MASLADFFTFPWIKILFQDYLLSLGFKGGELKLQPDGTGENGYLF